MRTRLLLAVSAAILITSCVMFVLPQSPHDYSAVPEGPFPAGSLWGSSNVIGASPAVDPDSSRYVDAMVSEHARPPGSTTRYELVVVVEGGSVPVYYADSADPRFSVPITSAGYGARGVTGVPIPEYAVPDSATDGHIAIIDQVAGVQFDFWQFRKERGRWVSSAAAIIDYTTRSVHADRFSVAASGFPLTAGLIWPSKLRSASAGAIDHPLVFGYPLTRDHAFVAPATRSDGWSSNPASLPMGARIQLDPDLDLSTLDPPLNQVELRIAEALQTYGAYLYDTGSPGSIIELNAVNPRSFSDDPYVGLDRYDADGGYIDVGNIPVDRFLVLELGPVSLWGTSYPPNIAFEERYYGVE